MWKTPEKSRSIHFRELTSECEDQLHPLSGNLKEQCPFITPNIDINSTSLMVDLGANVGRFTSIFARYGCKVHSFEPTDKTFQVLCKRFENKSNVICHKKAASVKNDMVKFYHHELSNYNPVYWSDGNSLLSSKTNVNKDDYEIVECIDFSEFIFSITQSQNVDLVKMDVEGAEIDIINHLIDTNAIDKINYLICEVHDRKNDTLVPGTKGLKQRVKNNNLENKVYFNWI